MEFAGRFVPFAGRVGLLSQVTYYTLVATVWAFLASFIFSLFTRESVVPEHRASRLLTTAIVAAAGLSYYLIQDYYRSMLQDLASLSDPAARLDLINDAYLVIGQLRYMDWTITTPLLLIKTVLMLKVKPHEVKGALALLLTADLWMVFFGYIGEQQLDANAEVLAGPRLLWGTISTLGYVIIPIVLYRIWQRFKDRGEPEERTAYKLMALTTVTFWGVYPLGYIVPALAPNFNYNWLHIAFSVADVINKVGVGVIVYLAGKAVLNRRVPEDATASVHLVN